MSLDPFEAAAQNRCPTCGCPLVARGSRNEPDRNEELLRRARDVLSDLLAGRYGVRVPANDEVFGLIGDISRALGGWLP